MPFRFKSIFSQYLLGLALALLIIPVVEGILAILPDIGWHFLTVIYITIFVFQILFYFLTSHHNVWWTLLSFISNFVLWTFEQVQIEKNFHDSFIYQGENYKIGVLILGGMLWVTNKIIIDKLLAINKSTNSKMSRMDAYTLKWFDKMKG